MTSTVCANGSATAGTVLCVAREDIGSSTPPGRRRRIAERAVVGLLGHRRLSVRCERNALDVPVCFQRLVTAAT